MNMKQKKWKSEFKNRKNLKFNLFCFVLALQTEIIRFLEIKLRMGKGNT